MLQYRIWSPYDKCYLKDTGSYNLAAGIDGMPYKCYYGGDDPVIEIPRGIVELSPGLKDTRGVAIYQNDLVSCPNEFGSPVATVEYIEKDGCWALVHPSFERTVTRYKRLTEKTIKESGAAVVGNTNLGIQIKL